MNWSNGVATYQPTNHSISKVTSRLNYCPAGELTQRQIYMTTNRNGDRPTEWPTNMPDRLSDQWNGLHWLWMKIGQCISQDAHTRPKDKFIDLLLNRTKTVQTFKMHLSREPKNGTANPRFYAHKVHNTNCNPRGKYLIQRIFNTENMFISISSIDTKPFMPFMHGFI